MAFILLVVIIVGLAYRLTSPEDRARYLGVALDLVRRLKLAATETAPEGEFRESLRARTPYMFVTPAIIAIDVIVFAGMLFGAGAIANPDTLVSWGAGLGTRTTNGEWWRLVTSMFVHTGTLHLLVNAAVLIQIGAVLERLVGRPALAAVYVSAGVFVGLVSLSSYPLAVNAGASGAIFGLYGLLFASAIWQRFERRPDDLRPEEDLQPDADLPPEADESAVPKATIPPMTMARLGAGAGVFLAYSALGGFAHAAEFTGLLVGAIYGLVLGRRVSQERPKTNRVAAALAAAAVIAVACATPLRNIADVKPEIVRVLATEERTVAAYRAASEAFARGRITAEALAQLAERTIVPELQAADARLTALVNVPPEQQPLVRDAREYLRLRWTSWRARAEAIRKTNPDPRGAPKAAADTSSRLAAEARFRSNLAALGKAEGSERVALEAFQRMQARASL